MVKKKNGFTLIELLITMSIMAILATMVAISIRGTLAKARDGKRKSDLGQIKTALTLYYNNFGFYPPSNDGSHLISGCDAGDCSWGQPWNKSSTNYMKIVPIDPMYSATYTYGYQRSDVNSFVLWARLEVPSDPDIAKTQAQCSYANVLPLFVVCAD